MMKKIIIICLTLITLLSCCSCRINPSKYDIAIVVPAGSTEALVYSHEEISPHGDTITIFSGEGLGDTEVILNPIQVTEQIEYRPTYLTPGMPVEMDVEPGAWYTIGVNMQNPTDQDITVYVTVTDITVRIK